MSLLNIALLFFIAAFLAVITLYMWYEGVKTSPRYLLRKRMRSLAVDSTDRRFPNDLRLEIIGDMSPFDTFLYRFKFVRNLDRLIDIAGLKADVKTVLLLIIASAALGYVVGLSLGLGAVFSLIFIPIGSMGPLGYMNAKKRTIVNRFTEQFPDALDMVSRSLQAGHSLGAALKLVGSEMSDPVANLFKTAYEEQSLGLSMREALEHMTKRMPGPDIKFFVMATTIHREIGGNLGEILERLAATIRDRVRIRRQVRVYTAQARLSGYILAATPVALALLFYFALPGYIEEIFTVPWGIHAVYVAIAAQIVGFIIIRRIIDIQI